MRDRFYVISISWCMISTNNPVIAKPAMRPVINRLMFVDGRMLKYCREPSMAMIAKKARFK